MRGYTLNPTSTLAQVHIEPICQGMWVFGEGFSVYLFLVKSVAKLMIFIKENTCPSRFESPIDFERFSYKLYNSVIFWATNMYFIQKWGRISPEIHWTNNIWPNPGTLCQTPALLVRFHFSNCTPTCWPTVQCCFVGPYDRVHLLWFFSLPIVSVIA